MIIVKQSYNNVRTGLLFSGHIVLYINCQITCFLKICENIRSTKLRFSGETNLQVTHTTAKTVSVCVKYNFLVPALLRQRWMAFYPCHCFTGGPFCLGAQRPGAYVLNSQVTTRQVADFVSETNIQSYACDAGGAFYYHSASSGGCLFYYCHVIIILYYRKPTSLDSLDGYSSFLCHSIGTRCEL